MFKVINGWTKEKMKEQIRLKNNGTQAADDTMCVYRTGDNNACAAGCFISDDDVKSIGNVVVGLLPSNILSKFPLEPYGMRVMQKKHDNSERTDGDMRDILCKWIDENVEE